MASTKSVNIEVQDAKSGICVLKLRRSIHTNGESKFWIASERNWVGFEFSEATAKELLSGLTDLLRKEVADR